ncbi:MAG: type II secretion system protein [Candidatus Gastranaerophilaceae bacterium]
MIKQSKAFTVSEVLITLGIIGFVIVMTLPNLMKDFQQKILNNQFKKVYSTINGAILKMRADLGYYPSCYYGINGKSSTFSECTSTFYPQLKAELNVAKDCANHAYSNGCIPYYNGGDTIDPNMTQEDKDKYIASCGGFSQSGILNSNPAYILSDGTIIFMYSNGFAPTFAVDINGMKKPNKWGFDVFALSVYGDGDSFKIPQGLCGLVEKGGKSTSQMLINAFK